MHVNRVLGLDKGIYSPEQRSMAGKLWYEMSIYHSFEVPYSGQRHLVDGTANVCPQLEPLRPAPSSVTSARLLRAGAAHAGTTPDDKVLRITSEEQRHAYSNTS